jgi:hypothetical protein
MRLLDPTTSRLHRRMVFVLAPPHSHADRVVSLLATALGAVAGPGPSRLFEAAVPQLVGNFQLGERFGLAALADEETFLGSVRRLTDAVFQEKAGDRRLVEYSPRHAERAGFLTAVYPDAEFVHVVRDPRAVAADAGLRKALPAARMWAAAHRTVLGAYGSGRMTIVRMEDLVERANVNRLLAALALEPGPGTEAEVEKLAKHTDRPLSRPLGFAVDVFAGDLLDVFGYHRRRR